MERIQNSAIDVDVDDNVEVTPQAPISVPSSSSSSLKTSSTSSLPTAKNVNNSRQQQQKQQQQPQLLANTLFDEDFKYPHEKYSKEANIRGGEASFSSPSDWHKWSHERVRRAATRKDDNRNTCSLFIQTDPLIWRHIREGVVDVSLILVFLFCVLN